MAFAAGTRLGVYEITGLIGVGGMGEVYRATDTKLGRNVAIKTLPSELANDPDRLARFEREAKLLAAMNHAHIAAIYGMHEHEGTQFLAMELVEGATLEGAIRDSAMPIEDALRLALQIAEALEAAHGKGVVHRDLKPANVMVTPNGAVKVLDFGLAKALSGDPNATMVANSPALSLAMTKQGFILGTAGYMSPEQASGQATDQRADIWAFGVVLYELLTGKPLFTRESVSQVLADVLRMPPDWSRLPKNLHPRVNLLLERCLEKNARNRYHSIADVRVDIEKVLSDPRGTAPAEVNAHAPTRSIVARLVAAVLLVFTGVALGGLGAWSLRSEPPETRGSQRLSVMLPPDQPIGIIGSPNLSLAISPDGTQLAYVAVNPEDSDGNTRTRLAVRSLATLTVRDVPGTTGAREPFFSPNGNWIGFFTASGELKKVSLAGGNPITLARDINGSQWGFGIWTPDDTIIFGAPNEGLRRIPAEGGEATALTTLDAARGEDNHLLMTSVPSGRAALFGARDRNDRERIEGVWLNSGERRVILENAGAPRVLSSGHLLFQRDDAVLVAPFDSEQLAVTGPAITLVDLVRFDNLTAPRVAQLAVSQNGTLVYLPVTAAEVALGVVSRDGAFEPLNVPRGVPSLPRVSPDGRAIAYVETRGPSSGIRVYDLQRGNTRPLGQRARFGGLAWHPDGRAITVTYRNSDASGIGLWSLDGDERLLLPGLPEATLLRGASWSPDALRLAYALQRGNQHDIWVLPDGQTTPAPFLDAAAAEHSPRYSPDGRWMAFTSDESGRAEVYVRRYPEGETLAVSTAGGAGPVWSPDGAELYFEGTQDDVPKLMTVSIKSDGDGLSLGEPVALFDLRVPGPTGVTERYFLSTNSGALYDVFPDGERFVMVRGPDTTREIVVVQNWFEELKGLVPTE